MNEKFYDLSKEKQDIMINGAMQVFAKNGYVHASTDEMVKVAGVSKGLWFHYFGNKKGLYKFVCTYAVNYGLLELSIKNREQNTDYFNTKLAIENNKLAMVGKYPYLPLLIISMKEEEDMEAKEITKEIVEAMDAKISEQLADTYKSSFGDVEIGIKINEMVDAFLSKLLREQYNSPVFSEKYYLENVGIYLDVLHRYGNCDKITH